MQLRLLQTADRTMPAMFISNIALFNCDDNIGKFDTNWWEQHFIVKSTIIIILSIFKRLNYIQCSTGFVTTYTCSGSHKVGLILNGLNREVRLCSFNLNNGECVNDYTLCTVDNELSITPTTLQTATASISYASEASSIGVQVTSESFSTLYPSSIPTTNLSLGKKMIVWINAV